MYDELVKALRGFDAYCRQINQNPSGIFGQAADAIQNTSKAYQMMAEAYEAEATKQRWIPVTERLPEEYVNVLCHLRSLDGQSEYYSIDHLMEDGQWWKAVNSWKHEVTHWVPLPEPPKDGE